MATELPVSFQMGALPPNIKVVPQELADLIASRLKMVTGASFALFVTGSTAPTSNVGPWWKDGNTWYYWDDGSGSYKPQILQPQSLGYTIGANPPDPTVYRVWISTTLAGSPLAVNIYYNGAWTDIYTAVLGPYMTTAAFNVAIASYSTTAQMNTAIGNSASSILTSVASYPAQGVANAQTMAIDGTNYKIAFSSAPINPGVAPFDTASNRYVAPVDGVYQAQFASQFDNDGGTASGMAVIVGLFKNGVSAGNGLGDIDNTPSPNGERWSPSFSGMIQLAQGDYIEVFAQASDGVNAGNLTIVVAQLSVSRISP